MKQFFLTILILSAMGVTAQQSNFHFSHTENTTASSARIWQIWMDVPNWNQWDRGLRRAYLIGEFSEGAEGKLIPDKGPKSKFIITEIVPGQSYTFKTKIPFGWLIIKRSLEARDGITYFTHDVEFTGLFKKVLGKTLGKRYKAMLPDVLSEIKVIAESK